jgi:hypothetical protein
LVDGLAGLFSGGGNSFIEVINIHRAPSFKIFERSPQEFDPHSDRRTHSNDAGNFGVFADSLLFRAILPLLLLGCPTMQQQRSPDGGASTEECSAQRPTRP